MRDGILRKWQKLMACRHGPHPYGVARLGSSLASQQPYDIALSLNLPRSPPNLAQGNFMLSVTLLKSTYTPPSALASQRSKISDITGAILDSSPTASVSEADVLFTSRRPAILTYTSRLVSLFERTFSLPFYILGLRRESELLKVSMAEAERFERGRSKVPEYVLLEIEAGQEVQVYDVRVHFTARFEGLRWLMYNYRILSFLFFTSAFWFAEIMFTIVGWIVLRSTLSTGKSAPLTTDRKGESSTESVVKKEPEDTDEPDLSDTPRTFPTYGRQTPLKYESRAKREDSEELSISETSIQPLAGEADDEDDELYSGRRGVDSGLGTSYSEGAGRGVGVARRRSSKGGRGGI